MLNDFYKIGQVIEVRGQKLRIRVFENKNSNILIYQGKIIKNVSVGSFVKIPKGFSNIIGKIEGEYIQESSLPTNNAKSNRFSKESETIDRIIEVSIMGVLDNDRFRRGLIDIPLVFSDVFILDDNEVQKIFEFSPNKEAAICIGAINDYKEEKLYVDTSSLFASHIGIFGNTGSGKSNTLAKLYTECFKKYKNTFGFDKSKFIVIDFNGEYTSAFDSEKTVYNLSTRTNQGNKIPISPTFLEDLDMWAIICEATEKTQRPFLNRTISLYKRLQDINNGNGSIENYLKGMLSSLFDNYFESPTLFVKQINLIKKIFVILFEDTNTAIGILDTIYPRTQQSKIVLCRDDNGTSLWSDNKNDFNENISSPVLNALHNFRTLDEYSLFDFSIKYKYMEELSSQRINEEHISPLIARFENRSKKVKQIFNVTTNILPSWLSIYSLADVNVEFKKIIPLIICKYFYERHKQNQDEKSLHIIIDEAHNILSTTSERESQTWKDYRLETFEEIIKEGRKFGVFLTISSQRPSDISETIISQLHNYFIHRLVNNEDIRAIGKAVSFIDNTSYEMISVLPQGTCIFTGVASNFPVLVQVDLLPKPLQPQSTTIDLVKLWSNHTN